MRDLIDIAYAALTDSFNGLVNAQEVRQKIDQTMELSWADRESWGESDAAQAAQQAMMDAAPPPAAPRPT